jgi:Tfp pilus assembly protein PilN
MKLKSNFAAAFGPWLAWLSGALWVLTALALCLTVRLALERRELRRALPRLEAQLKDLGPAPAPVAKAALPSPEEQTALRTRIRCLRALGLGQGPGVGALLEHLEGLCPAGVRLSSFQHNQDSGELAVTADAAQVEELSHFLASLEGDRSFSSVRVLRQAQVEVNGGRRPQFSLSLREAGR